MLLRIVYYMSYSHELHVPLIKSSHHHFKIPRDSQLSEHTSIDSLPISRITPPGASEYSANDWRLPLNSKAIREIGASCYTCGVRRIDCFPLLLDDPGHAQVVCPTTPLPSCTLLLGQYIPMGERVSMVRHK